MLSLARPAADAPIAVMGPHALDLTLALCRLGCDEVSCSCRSGAAACTERARLVIVGGPVTSQQLVMLLRDVSSLIGEEGKLVLQLADIDQDRVVETTLATRGLRIASTVFNLTGAPLVCHGLERVRENAGLLREAA